MVVKPLHKRSNYRPDIQGLRGVAVLLVVLYHAGFPLYGGYIGVDVFFVISGFVIARGIEKKLQENTFSFRQFYTARFRRLLPALAVTLGVGSVLNIVLGPLAGIKTSVGTAIAASFFNANHYLMRGADYFSPSTEYNAFLHTWSLSVEEQFYFFLPITMWALWRLNARIRPERRLIVGITALSGVSFLAAIYFTYWGDLFFIKGQLFAFYSVATRAWQFGLGILIALLQHRVQWTRTMRTWLGWISVIAVLLSALLITESTPFPGIAAIPPTLGAAGIILAGIGGPSPIRVLRISWMIRIGDLSYSWYLWHWPLMVMAAANAPKYPVPAMIAMIPVSYGAAVLSEKLVENPIRYRAKSERRSLVPFLTLSIIVPVFAVAGSYIFFKQALKSSADIQGFNEIRAIEDAEHAYSYHACREFHLPSEKNPSCTWNPDASKRVVLIGDSNAYQWSRALEELSEELDVQYTMAWRSGCLFTPGFEWLTSGKPQSRCIKSNHRLIEDLLQHPVDVVVLSTVIDSQLEKETGAFRRTEDDTTAKTYDEKAAMFHEGLVAFAAQLHEVGTELVLIDTIPKLTPVKSRSWWERSTDSFLYRRCSTVRLSQDVTSCGATRHVVDSRFNDQVRASAVWQNVPRARLIRSANALCPDDQCRSWDDSLNAPLYVNSGHISYHGSLRLKKSFRAALSDSRVLE